MKKPYAKIPRKVPQGPGRPRRALPPEMPFGEDEIAAMEADQAARAKARARGGSGGGGETRRVGAGLMDHIAGLKKTLDAGMEKWSPQIHGLQQSKPCYDCNGDRSLLLAASIAKSTMEDKLRAIYDDCWSCSPLQAVRKRANNIGVPYRLYTSEEINAAEEAPNHRAAYCEDYERAIVPFIRQYPNGSWVSLNCLEACERLGYLRVADYCGNSSPVLLVVTKRVSGASIADWLGRQAPLWVVDVDGLLRFHCETWARI